MENCFEFVPFEKVGPIYFGDKKSDVYSKLGNDYKSFQKYKELHKTDMYNSKGLLLYYDDSDGTVNFIEAFEPATVVFKGIKLSKPDYKKTVKEIRTLGYSIEKDDEGYSCVELGFGFYIPYEELEGVSFFKKGYYDTKKKTKK